MCAREIERDLVLWVGLFSCCCFDDALVLGIKDCQGLLLGNAGIQPPDRHEEEPARRRVHALRILWRIAPWLHVGPGLKRNPGIHSIAPFQPEEARTSYPDNCEW